MQNLIDCHRKDVKGLVVLLAAAMTLLLMAGRASAAPGYEGKKIFIVMSFFPEEKMEQAVKNTFDDLLRGATVRYLWLDAKNGPEKSRQKAEESYQIYLDFQPDVVVAVNDNAQELFVVPYLKNLVATPVVFTGVNDDATKYGFPADNVTGVLEKKHYRESISFAQLIDPGIQTIGIVYPDNLSQRQNVEQINKEKAEYGAQITEIVPVATVAELEATLRELSGKVDAFLIFNPVGIRDQTGKAMQEMDLYRIIMALATKPTIGVNEWEIEAGILCGVIKANSEQASLAVEQIDKIFAGQPVREIAVTENKNGQRYLNIITLKQLGLAIEPKALLGTEVISKQGER